MTIHPRITSVPGNTTRFNPGDIIVLRGVWGGKLWFACPAYVAQDTTSMLALFWPAGTPTCSPIGRPTVEDFLNNRIHLQERNWTEHDVLALAIPGSAHMIQLMWNAGTRQLHYWYVHLQETLRRSSIGFDTMDQMLDIVISPDRSCWQWKDEDEFTVAEQLGVYPPGKIDAIRQEAYRVINMLETNASPFCDGWEEWVPPADWGIPQFPPGWESAPLS